MRFLVPLLLSALVCYGQTNFYISTTGNDASAGSLAAPFLTLEGAQTAIQSLRSGVGLPTGGVVVNLRGGRYYRQATFSLSGTNDSGEVAKPIVYQSYPNETAYLIGGMVVTGFVSVTAPAILARLRAPAQANVLVANLAAQGVTNLGTIISHGDGHVGYNDQNSSTLYQSELLFQDVAMPLVRWPNTNADDLRISAPATNATGAFTFTGTNANGWASLTDVWVSGYWYYDFFDSWESVASIDTNVNLITLTLPASGGGYRTWGSGGHFHFFNVLEEMDMPGEYYIDRANTNLYFWPPSTITNGACIVSTLPTNIVVMTGVSNVTFSGITFEAGKMALININGGMSNLITGCTLRGGSSDGVKLIFSTGTSVSHCTISDMGERGVWIDGAGSRTNLVSGYNSITYNTFTGISRFLTGDRVAIAMSQGYGGDIFNLVGVYVAHNLFHDFNGGAITFPGNNHVIEYNEFYQVGGGVGDVGVIYAGYNWGFRGNIVRYNYIHDCHITLPGTDFNGVAAIYLDLFLSGTTVFGNVICATDHGVYIGGGRDNIVQNNIFVQGTNTQAKAFVVAWTDQRGTTSSYTNEMDPANVSSVMWPRLNAMPFTNALWSGQYPAILSLSTNHPQYNHPELALSNVISCNISYSNIDWLYNQNGAETNLTVVNNLTNTDPLFVNYSGRNFYLLRSSPAWALGFQWIPISRIGLDNGPTVNAGTANIGTMTMSP